MKERRNFLMKKFAAVVCCLTILVSLFSFTVFAAKDPLPTVFVSIADENGKLVLAYESVSLSDTDGDGVLTVHDALSNAHEAYYEDGKAGFSSEKTQYGMSVTKLWGVSNGGSYGCYVNDVSAMSCADTVKAGDHIYAFAYTDTVIFSDSYSYFDVQSVTAKRGDTVTVTLCSSGYDENWNVCTAPVANAVILINGVDSGIRTDENGKASITVDSRKNMVLSARSSEQIITPPVCMISVEASFSIPMIAYFCLICIVAAVGGILLMKRKGNHA